VLLPPLASITLALTTYIVCIVEQICKKAKAFLHSDLAQMAGKVPVNVDDMGIDIASMSSHKVE
jgi:cysteine sulfinate desulfinase/cysteine desulfurase-like protein